MRLDPARVAPVRWLNGAGSTRELAAANDDDGRTLWRISLADLDDDAVFSTFSGLDRVFTSLGDVCLTVDGSVVRLGPGEQTRFAGEVPVSMTVTRPTRALNVMVRRGVVEAVVVQRRADAPSTPGTSATVELGHEVADILLTPVSPVIKDSA